MLRKTIIGLVMAVCIGTQAHATTVKRQIIRVASKHNVSPKLALAIASVESGLKTPRVNRSGNIGIFQIRLSSAKEVGFRGSLTKLLNPTINIEYGIRYLKKCQDIYGLDNARLICCYNAGWSATDRVCASKQIIKYTQKVLLKFDIFSSVIS